LKVDKSAIKRVFKSVAVNRSRSDPCTDLSLYEFSIFSKEASQDFKQLMNEIKRRMVEEMRKEKAVEMKGVESIMPKRRISYIKNLPSSFNPLMNHFKDEDERADIRNKLKGTLKRILSIGQACETLDEILNKNADNAKELLASHFSDKDADEDKLFENYSKEGNMITKNNYDNSLRSNKGRKIDEKTSESLKKRKQRELRIFVQKAKEAGRKEAQKLIQIKAHPLCKKLSSVLSKRLSIKNRKDTVTSKRIKVDSLMGKMLSERLILRTPRSNCMTANHISSAITLRNKPIFNLKKPYSSSLVTDASRPTNTLATTISSTKTMNAGVVNLKKFLNSIH